MSSDKHRRLALEVAYLRLACREGGLAVNVKWARGMTRVLDGMIAAGDLVRDRVNTGQRKRVTTLQASPQGAAKLAHALARHGDAFGPTAALGRIEPVRIRKEVRRRNAIAPAERRVRQDRLRARQQAMQGLAASRG